ncbi:hypothetical protein Tco_0219123 [Tanacetum coccineum]
MSNRSCASIKDSAVDENIVYGCADDLNMPNLEEIVYSDDDKDVGVEANMTNLDTHIPVSPIPTTRIHKDHPVEQIIRDIHSAPQTRRMTKRVTNNGQSDILLVQVIFDDIINRSTRSSYALSLIINGTKISNEFLWTASTPMETSKPLMKDENAEDVDVHLYRLMMSLMYLTSLRPDIMFVYPKDSPFELEAYTDSDYAGASLDRKSTTRGCQFLGSRLISWQCKKQTVVANSTIEVEYVAAANCCSQVLWIQNQMLDYGYNFMNTKIFIDNESTNVKFKIQYFHSKTTST